MRSLSFRVISGLITLLLLVLLVTVVLMTVRSQPATLILPSPTVRPTATATATNTPIVSLGAELRVATGGYAFRLPEGYRIDLQEQTAGLFALETTNTLTSSIVLSGGEAGQITAVSAPTLADAFEQYLVALTESGALRATAAQSTTVSGAAALVANLNGEQDEEAVAGRIVMAQPASGQLFVALGVAAAAEWQSRDEDVFTAVVESVRFFPPLPAAAVAATATPASTPKRATTTPIPIATPAITVTAAATATTLFMPTPTPAAIPVIDLSSDTWTTLSDANFMNDVIVVGNTIWFATEGGALAWTRGSTTPVKFTSTEGLSGNRLTAVANCDLPQFGVVFGGDAGLRVADLRAGGWRPVNSSNSGMRFDDVAALDCNSDLGYLVIGYASHGIDIYDARNDTWRHLDRNSGLASNTVRSLAVIGNLEEIWVVAGDGVTRSAGPDSTFYNAGNSPLENNNIGAIAAGEDSAVWLGGEGALLRASGESWTRYDAESVAGDFPSKLITGLAVAQNGTLWLSDVDGAVCHFVPAENACTEYFSSATGMAEGPVTALALDGQGQVYYTTAGNGYSVYDGERWQLYRKRDEIIGGNRIQALAADAGGALWLATEAGIQRLNGVEKAATVLPLEEGGIDPAAVQSLYPDGQGGLWVGTTAGAFLFDGEAWQSLTIDDGLVSNIVQAIVVDGRGRVWFGTDQGLSIWNGTVFFTIDEARGLPSGDIRALLQDGDVVWIGSAGGGLYRFENNQLQVFSNGNIKLPSDQVLALALTADGALMVGTDQGLAQLQGGAVTVIQEIGAVAVSAIAAFNDQIWVGTESAGVYYDSEGGWQQLTTAAGLPANSIAAMEPIAGTLWIGGVNGGILRHTP